MDDMLKESGQASTSQEKHQEKNKYKVEHSARQDEEVRAREIKQHGDTKVSGEGGGGSAPGIGAEIPLQAVVKTMVKQLCPCSPWVHRECRDPPAAHGGGAHAGADGCLEEAVIW
ncbi:uncharacterized protein LOC143691968 [Agelaius phoeniceus]|uniref:uncharacterized protein LOC143691968 n=1 Tax=Agelaius phoeniceus TaxID=39638 RepID=UPI004054C35C